ncbi:OsmC family protein [Gephyromycinifex aptenodytis]|uniref:OsmC family protein n=1 Tax=Gephyromycinifex aptenodytis TaxID=2716227 RepID=UPI001445AF3C|nr:OsmC family protein [Gephyromycinifex aptenodytis]
MSDQRHAVQVIRTGPGTFEAVNERGARMSMGSGDSADFTPVELLLAAAAGCAGIDVDLITARRAEPEEFSMQASGEKVHDEEGSHLTDVRVAFTVRFPSDEGGDEARQRLPRAIEQSRDRLCTVSRTIALPTSVTMLDATT